MGVDKPSAPDVNYKDLWKNYLTWSSDQASRFNKDRGMTEATMARQGLKRDSKAWELNLSNLHKQQDKDRSVLSKGITASQLKEKVRQEMAQFKAYGHDKAPDYKAIARQEFESEMQSAYGGYTTSGFGQSDRDPKRLTQGQLSRYSSGHDRLPFWAKDIKSVEDREAEMREKSTTEYEKGKWFEKITTSTYVGGDADRWSKGTSYRMTDAGKKKMGELMSSSDNVFGRELKEWEAYATLRYGSDIASEEVSEEAMSAGRATAAASGARASAVELMAEQSATASPWVKKQTNSFF